MPFLGSLERFLGILIEEYAGRFPTWLALMQVVVMNITDKQADYVEEVKILQRTKGIRASFDLRNEKIGFKIREHTLRRVPLFVGRWRSRKMENKEVAVRTRDGIDLGKMRLEDFATKIHQQISLRVSNCWRNRS